MTIPAHSFFRSSLFPALADYHVNRMRPNQTMSHEVGARSRRVVDRRGKTKVSFPFAWLMLSNSGAFFEYMSEITGTKLAPDSSPTTSAEICYVVDDDPSVRKSITRLLELEGFKVRAFGNPEDFLNQMETNPVRLVVLDIWMQQMTGMEVLAHLCARWPGTRVIFITGHEDRAAEATVMQAGASGFFIKPSDNEKFISDVQDALEQA